MTAGQDELGVDRIAAEASRLIRRILSSARELERRFDDCLASHGLNLTRADVLATVAQHGEAGCSQSDLASALQLSESNICTLVERMRSDGWLFRLRSEVDRRRCVVVLAPRAIATLEQVDKVRRARAADWMRNLTPGELIELNSLLDRFLLALLQRPAGPNHVARPQPEGAGEKLRRAS